jgi:GTP-binding nuclear protein Ran
MTLRLKICIVGDGGVGKTAFTKIHRTGEFKHKYVPTMGVEVHPVLYDGPYEGSFDGDITLNMWDTAGIEKYGGLNDGYYHGAHAFIVMFDVTNRQSFLNVPMWIEKVKTHDPHALIVVVENKNDLKGRKISARFIKKFQEIFPYAYFDVSSKSRWRYNDPIQYIVERVVSEHTIKEAKKEAKK